MHGKLFVSDANVDKHFGRGCLASLPLMTLRKDNAVEAWFEFSFLCDCTLTICP
jgi:hypothetical protein